MDLAAQRKLRNASNKHLLFGPDAELLEVTTDKLDKEIKVASHNDAHVTNPEI